MTQKQTMHAKVLKLTKLIDQCDQAPLLSKSASVYEAVCALAFGEVEDDLDACIRELDENRLDAMIELCEFVLQNRNMV